MSSLTDSISKYIRYIAGVRRYSPRTVEIYRDALERFAAYAPGEVEEVMTANGVRG